MTFSNPTLAATGPANTALELKRIYRRITLRLIPFLMLLYLVAFLNRVNVSFAALTMNSDLGLSNTLFGIGAGIFFVGYVPFEVPSNFMLAKVGARLWLTVLLVLMGLVSTGFAFVHTSNSYMVMRFLLGAAESGFFPGVVLYLTFWLPASVRGGLMSLFIVSIPLSTVVGAPLSMAILKMNGIAGLRGWQWLFVLEGGLAILVGLMIPKILADSPKKASWLSPQESTWLAAAISAESRPTTVHASWVHLFRSRTVLGFALGYFILMIGLYGLSFWIPRILTSQGLPVAQTGWMTALPYVIATVGMVLWSRHSDASGERTWHVVLAFLVAALGMYIASVTQVVAVSVAGFSIAALGICSAMPLFWVAATEHLGENGVAGIALINGIGCLGGFFGPFWMGWLVDRTHFFSAGLLAAAITLALGAALMYGLSRPPPSATTVKA
jgi:ACS family tartrate transporter-like MFS transporter